MRCSSASAAGGSTTTWPNLSASVTKSPSGSMIACWTTGALCSSRRRSRCDLPEPELPCTSRRVASSSSRSSRACVPPGAEDATPMSMPTFISLPHQVSKFRVVLTRPSLTGAVRGNPPQAACLSPGMTPQKRETGEWPGSLTLERTIFGRPDAPSRQAESPARPSCEPKPRAKVHRAASRSSGRSGWRAFGVFGMMITRLITSSPCASASRSGAGRDQSAMAASAAFTAEPRRGRSSMAIRKPSASVKPAAAAQKM